LGWDCFLFSSLLVFSISFFFLSCIQRIADIIFIFLLAAKAQLEKLQMHLMHINEQHMEEVLQHEELVASHQAEAEVAQVGGARGWVGARWWVGVCALVGGREVRLCAHLTVVSTLIVALQVSCLHADLRLKLTL
jgi:hypothetical protein